MKEPEIVRKKELKLVGKRVLSDGKDRKIMRLWREFLEESREIPLRVNSTDFIGHFRYVEVEEKESLNGWRKMLEYMAAVEVKDFSEVPPGMVTKVIPEQLYARFRHKGSLHRISERYIYIFGTWLPFSGYIRSGGPDFEYYGENFNSPDNEEAEMDIYIAIEKELES